MGFKIITSSFILIHILASIADGTPLSEYNETNLIMTLSSQLSGIRASQERQAKSMVESLQYLRKELVRQGEQIDRLVKDESKPDVVKHTTKVRNCTDATVSGIYDILIPKFSSEPFKVACDSKTRNGGWTIILRRMDGSVKFDQNWNTYKKGFGQLDGEFFLGLDKLHALTTERSQELLVLLEDNEGNERYEFYERFAIGDEDGKYALHTLGKANGTAGDSLLYHHGMPFTTYDRDNDHNTSNCAVICTAAWWYNDCYNSNLLGTYNDNTIHKGILWKTFKGLSYSLKKAVMMIRPRR